jgi:hypothetical protein
MAAINSSTVMHPAWLRFSSVKNNIDMHPLPTAPNTLTDSANFTAVAAHPKSILVAEHNCGNYKQGTDRPRGRHVRFQAN